MQTAVLYVTLLCLIGSTNSFGPMVQVPSHFVFVCNVGVKYSYMCLFWWCAFAKLAMW